MRIAAIGVLALVWLGCGTTRIAGQYPTGIGTAEPSGVFRAGLSRVDLTPLPGTGMGGYSTLGEVSRGVWLRLYARAVYLEAPDGPNLVLVATDLWSLPEGLLDRVAERLSEHANPSVRRIRRAQLVLSASHTHHSPGHYATDRFFGAMAQVESGFQPALFEEIATRITEAVARAIAAAEPAHLRFTESTLHGLQRNRSLGPFLENPEAQTILGENPGAVCEKHPDEPRDASCAAVDRRLRSLEVRAVESGALLGVLGFLTLHATTIGAELPLISSDVFGAIALETERELAKRHGHRAVVALFNGAQGDVSPAWRAGNGRNREDLLRLANIAVAKLLAPDESRPLVADRIAHRRQQLPLGNQCLSGHPGDGPRCTARLPLPGHATLAGAEDGPSNVGFFWFEGFRNPLPWGRQGAKVPALNFLELGPVPLFLPLLPLSQMVFTSLQPAPQVEIGLHDVGPLRFVTLPGEFTTTLGRRIADAVADERSAREVVLLGLTNGYAYYFTTPEEYARQHYEGSGTLYGPAAPRFLLEKYGALAGGEAVVARPARQRSFEHESVRSRDYPWPGVSGEARDAAALSALFGAGSFRRLCFETPAGLAETPRLHAASEGPGPRWEPLSIDGVPEDDTGTRFVLLAGEDAAERTPWCGYWRAPGDAPVRAGLCWRAGSGEGCAAGEPLELP